MSKCAVHYFTFCFWNAKKQPAVLDSVRAYRIVHFYINENASFSVLSETRSIKTEVSLILNFGLEIVIFPTGKIL
jgi:hypothetical protein